MYHINIFKYYLQGSPVKGCKRHRARFVYQSKPIRIILCCKQPIKLIHLCKQTEPGVTGNLFLGSPVLVGLIGRNISLKSSISTAALVPPVLSACFCFWYFPLEVEFSTRYRGQLTPALLFHKESWVHWAVSLLKTQLKAPKAYLGL